MASLLDMYHRSGSALHIAELQAATGTTLDDLVRSQGFSHAFVVLLDLDHMVLEGAFGVNTPPVLVESLSTRLNPQDPIVQAVTQGEFLRVADTQTDRSLDSLARQVYLNSGLTSFTIIPLEPVTGVLVISKEAGSITFRDITSLLPRIVRLAAMLWGEMERQKLSESAARSVTFRDWLSWMLDSVPDPIVLTDEENNILWQNGHAQRLFQTDQEDSEGRRRAIEMNNFLFSTALSSFALDQGQRAALAREFTLVDPVEGSELLFEVITNVYTATPFGERVQVSILRNLTDLHLAVEQQQRSFKEVEEASRNIARERDRLNLILESVADPIVVTSPGNEIVLMNPPAQRLLQLSKSPAGLPTSHMANEAKLTAFLFEVGLDSANVRQGELQLADPPTDEALTFSVTSTKVWDRFGTTLAIVSVLHDLTALKELERRRVERQLFESEKMAAVGRLAAAVAHEINNPLEAIKNALYLLLDNTQADSPDRRFLDIANREIQRVSDIIRQMLGFYRPGTTKAPTSVNVVVEDALVLLPRQMRRQNIRIRTDLEAAIPLVIASGDQLKQVFLNLFLNALEAMGQNGDLRIVTRVSRGQNGFEAGKYVVVEVADTGPGIPEDRLDRIFDPFFTTKQDQKGTGLGLWVSQDIVQQHGGRIAVRSRVGKGSTFFVGLPIGGDEK